MKYAILDKPSGLVIGAEFYEWNAWFENPENRVIAKDRIGEIEISTVFLGINHGNFGQGPDQWFETMVFKPEPQWPEGWGRYSTMAEARAGHARAVSHYNQPF